MTDQTPDIDPSHAPEDEPNDEELAALVEETVNALLKAARARQTYVLGNPLIEKFQTELSDKLGAVWDVLPHLALTFDEGRLLWRDREVYSKPMGPDNFAFRFFKEGTQEPISGTKPAVVSLQQPDVDFKVSLLSITNDTDVYQTVQFQWGKHHQLEERG